MKEKPLTINELRIMQPFNTLAEKDLQNLFNATDVVYIHEGEKIFSSDENANAVYIVTAGSVRLIQSDGQGHELIVRIASKGDFLGYTTLFPKKIYHITAVAIKDCRLLRISKKTAMQLIKISADVSIYSIREIAQQLTIARYNCMSLTHKQVRGRMAYTLLLLKREHSIGPDGFINVELSRDDIGKLSNMTTANAIRTLKELQQDKLIEVNDRHIKILDEDALRHISTIG